MSLRSRSNNFIASMIAVLLFAAGIGLGIVHRQLEQEKERQAEPAGSPSEVAQVKAGQANTERGATGKSEMDITRESIDWSDAPSPAPERIRKDGYDVYVNVTREYLDYVFDRFGYTGEKIESGETVAVPPLLVVSIGKGWSDGMTVPFKKSLFYRVMLALILYENDDVLRDRERLQALLDDVAGGASLSPEQAEWVADLADRYGVEIGDGAPLQLTGEITAALLERVDMVPPSLALAQAAHESGYATSRFVHTGNALFGQWDWSPDAIRPLRPREGMGDYGVKAFEQPLDSVRAYFRNLNTHRAYAGFRALRASQRGDHRGRMVFDVPPLAGTLTSYSERGTAYTEELKTTISLNGLERADHLRLMSGEPIYFQ